MKTAAKVIVVLGSIALNVYFYREQARLAERLARVETTSANGVTDMVYMCENATQYFDDFMRGCYWLEQRGYMSKRGGR